MKVKRRILSLILLLTTLTSFFTGASAVLANDPHLPGANMVVNGDFESGLDDNMMPISWNLNNPAGKLASITLEKSGGMVYQGDASLKFTAPSDTNNDQISVTEAEYHQVDPSKTYIIEFYAKVPSGVIHLFVDELNAPNPRKDMVVDAHMWANTNWTKFSVEYTPTANVEYARLEFYNWNPIALEGYIDNVVFREKSPITIDQKDITTVYGNDQMPFTVSGILELENHTSFQINGLDVSVDENGRFIKEIALNIGENMITITATGADNQEFSRIIKVTLIELLGSTLSIRLDQPDGTIIEGLENRNFIISGAVTDEDGDFRRLTVNGEEVVLSSDGTFQTSVVLKIGQNAISVVAEDDNNNREEKTISIILRLPKVDQPYDIGVFYFSNWNGVFFPGLITNNKATYGSDSDWFGGVREHLLKPGPWSYGPIPDREPLLGWYDDRQQEILDNHILQAASRGIDHFSFYYYWREGGGGPRPGQNVENFRNSPYRDLMSYYLYFVADGSYGSDVWKNEIVPKLISFMKETNYKKTDEGRPILGLYGDMEGRLGGSAVKLKEGLDYLRNECMKEGLENPLLLYDGYRTLDAFIAQGYDGFLPLNLAGIGLDDNKGTPEDYASSYPGAWNNFVYADYSNQPEYQNYENYLFIPGALNAYDVRPWKAISGNPVERYVYADPSPEKFAGLLENVKDYLDTHPRSMNMATIYAWNEWGEGGSIEPNTLFGYGYIDAMQEVFNLKNSNYKITAAENEINDIAPDLRIRVEPEYSVVTEGQNVKLKVSIKNYSDSEVSGTLSLNANGWTLGVSAGEVFTLNSGEAASAEFNVTAEEGDHWNKHSFEVTASYEGMQQTVSTFVVKAAPLHASLEKDSTTKYKDCRFDIRIKARNYTLDPKTVSYALELPDGWTANAPSGDFILNGYNGEGVHTGRTSSNIVTISYPETIEPGKYTIRLITTDGTFTTSEDFIVDVTELFNLLYNGSFEIDENNDGMPDVWVPGYSGGEITVVEGTQAAPAPVGSKYVRVDASIPADHTGGYREMGIKQEGTKTDVNWLIIDPSKKYELSFWAKVEKGSLRAADTEVGGVYYDWIDYYNSSLLITAEENGNVWKKYSFTFFPHPHAGRISTRFHIDGEAGEEVVFYLDGVVLKEVDVKPEENMIVNGGMETDINGNGVADGWSTEKTGGSLSFVYDWQDQYGGIRSQKISGTNAAGSCFKQEWFDVTLAKQYIVEFWAKVTSGTFSVVSAEKADENGTVAYNSKMDFSSDTWQKYTYVFKPQAGMIKQSLRFIINGNETSTAWIDNVVMRPDPAYLGSAPVINLDQTDGTVSEKRKFIVSGTVSDEDGDLNSITVNGNPLVCENNAFEIELKLEKGINEIIVIAGDNAGNITEKTLFVTYKEPQ